MQKIASVAELKNAIQELEVEQSEKGKLLKEQLFIIYKSLRPGNILISAVKDITSSPYLVDNILGAAMGLVSGIFTRKIFIGAPGNKIKKLIGHALQFGVINLVARHPRAIKLIGRSIIKRFTRKKRMNSIKP